MNELRVSLVQADLRWEDTEANLLHLGQMIDGLAGHTDLILLPEMFGTGFSMQTSLAEQRNGAAVTWMKKQAAKSGAVLCGSLMMEDQGLYFNRLLWAEPDGTLQHYDKRHLFGLGQEHEHYTAGHALLQLTWRGWRIRPLICYDLRFPVWSRQTTSQPYDLLLYVANWPERRSHAWRSLLTARAIENQCYVAGVNRVGHDGHQIAHRGDSRLLDPLGELLLDAGQTESVVTGLLRMDLLQQHRAQLPFLKDADSFIISKP